MAWELLEDTQFPLVMLDLAEVAKYALLWATKDVQHVQEKNIFWILMEMSIRMGINHKLQLSPIVYASLQSFARFKADFHHVFTKAQKDSTNTWHSLPYLGIDDVIFVVLESWLLEWWAVTGSAVETDNSVVQCKMEETKLRMVHLAEKFRKDEVESKTQAAHDTAKLAKQQGTGGEEREG